MPNGVIITYEVVYEGPQESGAVNTTALSFALNNLGPNSSYTFTVSGYTLAGRGANVTVYSTPIEHSKLYHPCNSTEVLETVPYNTFHVYSLYSIIQFHLNVIKLGRALRPNLISCDLHVTTLPLATPPIDKASRNGACNRGFFIVGPRTRSRSMRRGVWKASQPKILLSLVAMPAGALTFW